MRRLIWSGLAAGVVFAAATAGAADQRGEPTGKTPEMTGTTMMRHVAEADGVRDMRGHVTFKQVSADKRDQVTFGLLSYKQVTTPGGPRGAAGKILFTVLTPPRLSGLGFLAWTYPEPGRAPDQWLYLPELRQVRRVTPRDPLEGTADTVLTFADMRSRPVEEEVYTFLRSEPLMGQACWVVEGRPRLADSGYRRRLFWVDQVRDLVLKVEYYDQQNALLKTQMIGWQRLPSPCAPCGPDRGGREAIGAVWAWKGSVVTNVQTGQRTHLELHILAVNTGLDDDLFTERTLRTGVQP